MADIQTYDPNQLPPLKFNPADHLMQIKNGKNNSDYLEVKFRLVWFREACPTGVIKTNMVLLDLDRETEEEVSVWNKELNRSEKIIKRANGIAIFHTVIEDGKGGHAEGTKCEKAASFGDFIEKAETGSIGRALASLGYGTQFVGEEFDEGHRIVDAPVQRQPERKQQTEADKEAYKNRRVVVDSAPQAQDAQTDIVKQMVSKAQARAKKFVGVSNLDEWNKFVTEALGEPKPTGQLDVSDVTRINGLLTKREQGAVKQEA